jgi:NADH-quinone oxidoreductase E subunit
MLLAEKNAMLEEIEQYVAKYGNDRSALLSILHEIQKKHRFISEYAQQEVARMLDIHPVEVYSFISFYAFLNSEPKGRNLVRICKTISCDMVGKDAIVKAIERELGIEIGGTTRDNKFTVEYANCLGMCEQGPVMTINDRVYGKVTPEKAVKLLQEVKN